MESDSSVNAVRHVAGPFGNADLLCHICAFVPLGGSRLLLSSRVHVKMLPVLLGALDSKAMFCTLLRAMANTICRRGAVASPYTKRCRIERFHKRFRYHSNEWSYERLDPCLAFAIAYGADADLIYGLLCVQRNQQAGQEYEAQGGVGPKGSCDSVSEITSAAWCNYGTPLYAACKRDDAIVSLLLSFGVCGHTVDGVQFAKSFDTFSESCEVEFRETALLAAASAGRESTVRLLLRHKADPMETGQVMYAEVDPPLLGDVQDEWFDEYDFNELPLQRRLAYPTPLAVALQKHQAGVVKALLDCGVCPSKTCEQYLDHHGRATRLNGFDVAAKYSWAGLDHVLASCPSSCRCRCCCRGAHSGLRDLVWVTTYSLMLWKSQAEKYKCFARYDQHV